MDRLIQRFIRRNTLQTQVLAEGDEQSVVDGTIVFRADFQGGFEEADGRYDVDRDARKLVEKKAGLN